MRTHSHPQKPSLINAPSFFSRLAVLLLIVAGSGYAQQEANKLFQSGLYQEEAKGDLGAAIQIYQQILKDYSGDRPACAKALLQMGGCYEKLGNQEAVKKYQILVNDFPGQKNEVALAKERLSRLIRMAEKVSKTPLKPKFRKIDIPTRLSWYVELSPDGKQLALVSDKQLWKVPLSGNLGPGFSGTPVQLNTEGIKVDREAGLSWSGDGKWIAFNELPSLDKPEKEKLNQSIYVVSSEGGKPTKVIENFRAGRIENFSISLSTDGKKLAHSSIENEEQHVYLTPVAGGSARQLADIQAREPAFSSDGKWIAYVEDERFGTGGGNLWIVPAIGGEPKLIAKAGYTTSPVWSPDNSMIAFVDDDKQTQINLVEVPKEGKETGNLISIDIPQGMKGVRLLAGWTADNKIGAVLTKEVDNAIYSIPARGGVATVVLNDCWAMMPRWSPDGSQIYYTSSEIKGSQKAFQLTLASVPANGGTGKFLAKDKDGKKIWQLGNQGGNRISPDGKIIISAAWQELIPNINFPRVNLWKISTDGLESEKITDKEGHYFDASPSWSPDGNKIAFIRAKIKRTRTDFLDTTRITTINSSGGDEKVLVTVSDKWINSLVWSPDGRMLAYLSKEKEAPNTKYVNFINPEDGTSIFRWETSVGEMNKELSWSPDSKRIAFNDRGGKVIKIMNIEDGTIEDINTNLGDVRIGHIDWSPDGKNVVFAGGKRAGQAELWLMEDFLPLDKLSQEPEAANEPEGISIKQIWKSSEWADLGTVSADGMYRSWVADWGEGDLAIHNLVSGENRKLTHEAKPGHSLLLSASAISKNGEKVAYCWSEPNHTSELCLIDVANLTPQVLHRQEGERVFPMSWLSDNELIMTRYIREPRSADIVSFNIPDKTLQVLKPFERINWPQLSCSPDEKHIAYDFENETHGGAFDINILSMDGTGEIALVEHPANDRVLGWVPGRKEFLFLSDRSGTLDLWALSVDDGKPSGPAKKIYADIGDVTPMGFTENGDCYIGFSRRNFSAYLTPFNAENGELNEKQGKSLRGSNFQLKWSPDGQSLAYISENIKYGNQWQLTIRDLKTGQERKLATNLFRAQSPCWSPDGNSILVLGREKSKLQTKGYYGDVFLVDVKTGQTTTILLLSDYKFNVPDDKASPLSDLEWSADGKSFYYLFFKDRLVKHDLKSGEDKVLYKQAHFDYGSLSRSPDGKMLIFAARSPEEKKSRLFTIPVEGGQAKELCTPQEADGFYGVMWSPDGKYIYFAERQDGTNLWRIPSEGGTPQKIWHSKNGAELLSIHPDGNQIAFSIRERITEIRAIQNLRTELSEVFKKNE
jgi:Tol biopolymer transport system component